MFCLLPPLLLLFLAIRNTVACVWWVNERTTDTLKVQSGGGSGGGEADPFLAQHRDTSSWRRRRRKRNGSTARPRPRQRFAPLEAALGAALLASPNHGTRSTSSDSGVGPSTRSGSRYTTSVGCRCAGKFDEDPVLRSPAQLVSGCRVEISSWTDVCGCWQPWSIYFSGGCEEWSGSVAVSRCTGLCFFENKQRRLTWRLRSRLHLPVKPVAFMTSTGRT